MHIIDTASTCNAPTCRFVMFCLYAHSRMTCVGMTRKWLQSTRKRGCYFATDADDAFWRHIATFTGQLRQRARWRHKRSLTTGSHWRHIAKTDSLTTQSPLTTRRHWRHIPKTHSLTTHWPLTTHRHWRHIPKTHSLTTHWSLTTRRHWRHIPKTHSLRTHWPLTTHRHWRHIPKTHSLTTHWSLTTRRHWRHIPKTDFCLQCCFHFKFGLPMLCKQIRGINDLCACGPESKSVFRDADFFGCFLLSLCG